MFIDASVLVSVLIKEDDWTALAAKLEASDNSITSPLATWETSVAATRGNAIPFDLADRRLASLLWEYDIRKVPITPAIGALAVEASRRFGRGRHPAALNFGDCFAYACARAHGVPLLFKGDDFPQTDIEPA